MVSEFHFPVVIIGGGIVGLSASLFLSYQNVNSLVIERHSGTSIHPRARSVNARTMELFRHLGIDDRVRKAGASLSPTMGIYSGQSLKEVIESKPRREEGRKFPLVGMFAPVSPVNGAWVTQDMIEPVLVDTARERGGEVRFHTECVEVAQDNTGVTAILKDRKTGINSTVRADYLIAADGAKSPIRSALRIPTSGRGAMGHLLNILFHADLEYLVRGREFSLCKIDRPEVYGLFTSINNSDRWVFHLAYDPSKGEKASDFTAERCKDLLRLALGMPDVEINIVSILPWEPTVQVAERLQEGRVFLAGDAAHQMPPWGGQGANSGIADVHNLAWKIATVLQGHADRALLETYNIERLPVGIEAAESSAIGADAKGLISVNMNLTGYASPAICKEDVSPLGGWTWRPWTLPSFGFAIDGRPGRRAPHFWVDKKEERISTLDLFGKNFILLAGADGSSWSAAAKETSLSLGIEIAVYSVGPDGDLVASRGEFEAAAGISSNGAILVRPDDFVVWRERRQPSDYHAKLNDAYPMNQVP
ncbi:FAD-binding monooxygenase-like protein [Melanomma pulvis-pyrius CBS 109.77]|uniref:FAD-binding monooxygenase-like protein n=1 Tax=Melanomma pulvis-pyrius CBS 109.77 TaxID=1314802 RepID=A0A6A6X2G6_9PLEO|nr:FAD-binding monooxygenase-like protein [Melanomma pulvis-pyrius CBS 109.77]